jgi:hypothetical protein
MFDFPTNPASGTVVMLPDGSYRVWDSTKWRASPSSSTITTGPFLPIAGGTMTGPLTVPRLNISSIPPAQPDGSPPAGSVHGDIYNNGGFLCIAP